MLVRGYALSGESVIAIVGNYDFCGWINEESCPLDMHQAIALPPSKPETPPGNDWRVHCIWDRRRRHQVPSTIGSPGFTSGDGVPGTQHTLPFAVPVAFLFGGAFVVRLLALGQSDLDLDVVAFPVHGGRYQRVALALDGADEFVDFTA